MNKRCLSLVFPAAAALTLNTNAALISISFDGSQDFLIPNVDSTELAGAPSVRVANWNPWADDDVTMGDGGQVIVDDSGTSVAGFTAVFTGDFRGGQRVIGSGNDDPLVFGNMVDVWGGQESVAVSGIPYANYDVYVYMYDDRDGRAGSFTIGSTTYYARGIGAQSGAEAVGNPADDGSGYVLSTDTTLGASTDIDQGNYVVFEGLSGSSFNLGLSAVNAGNLDRNKVAGFQIVETIPEPSSSLLALLAIGFGTLRRRR